MATTTAEEIVTTESIANINQVCFSGIIVDTPTKQWDKASQSCCLSFSIENDYKSRKSSGKRHVKVMLPQAAKHTDLAKGTLVKVEGAIDTSFANNGAKDTFIRATALTRNPVSVSSNEALVSGNITGQITVRRTKSKLSITRFTLLTANGPVDIQVSGGDVLEQALELAQGMYAVVAGRLHSYKTKTNKWVMEIAASKIQVS